MADPLTSSSSSSRSRTIRARSLSGHSTRSSSSTSLPAAAASSARNSTRFPPPRNAPNARNGLNPNVATNGLDHLPTRWQRGSDASDEPEREHERPEDDFEESDDNHLPRDLLSFSSRQRQRNPNHRNRIRLASDPEEDEDADTVHEIWTEQDRIRFLRESRILAAFSDTANRSARSLGAPGTSFTTGGGFGGTNSSIQSGGLSCLSCSAKHSIALNQLDRVEISSTYERDDGVTIYVMDVYLRYRQTGIPSRKRASCGSQREVRKQPRKPEYQVEHRFSDFYQMRKDLSAALHDPKHPAHSKWCRYCSRLDWLVVYGTFPLRVPFAFLQESKCWRQRIIKSRSQQLTIFLNRILNLSKDTCYRRGTGHCEGYEGISKTLTSFLAEPNARSSITGW